MSMSKFKKEYDHTKESVVEACGFDTEKFTALIVKGEAICAKNNMLSEAVEELEQLFKNYDSEMILRFFTIHFIQSTIHKNNEMASKHIRKMLKQALGESKKSDVFVFEETDDGFEHIETINRSDDPELYDKITETNCSKCDKKDNCKIINGNTKH
jgi:hypothetical protein